MINQKAFVFDLDGTLFETTATDTGTESAPNFIEFADADKLLNESSPLPLLKLAQQVQAEGHKVYILTARQSVIAPAIKTLLKRYGVEAEYVFTVGDRGFDIPAYKAEILSQLAHQNPTYFWDDDANNLTLVPRRVRSYLAKKA
jgi:hydroxymethylpyrimidine pyrophosphatase-like HAD family hydrolase